MASDLAVGPIFHRNLFEIPLRAWAPGMNHSMVNRPRAIQNVFEKARDFCSSERFNATLGQRQWDYGHLWSERLVTEIWIYKMLKWLVLWQGLWSYWESLAITISEFVELCMIASSGGIQGSQSAHWTSANNNHLLCFGHRCESGRTEGSLKIFSSSFKKVCWYNEEMDAGIALILLEQILQCVRHGLTLYFRSVKTSRQIIKSR